MRRDRAAEGRWPAASSGVRVPSRPEAENDGVVEELLKYTKKSFRLEVLPVDSEVLLWGGATQAIEEYVLPSVGGLGQSTPQLVGTEAMTAVVRANRANSTILANRLSCTERY